MRTSLSILSLVLLLLLICTASTLADPGTENCYAIRAGKILTMAPRTQTKTPRVINHGIILVSKGKIEALGPKDEIDIPVGYTVIDASHPLAQSIVKNSAEAN